MSESFFLNVMLSICAGLLSILLAFIRYWARRVDSKLDAMAMLYPSCQKEFANAKQNTDNHRRMWNKLEEHDNAIAVLRASIEMRDDDGK